MDKKLTSIKERILLIPENKGISKEDFFSSIQMTYGNFKGENKKRPLNSDALENILTIYPDVNPNWLLTGEGPMLRDIININQNADGFYNNNMLGDHNTVNEPMEKYGTNDNDCSEKLKEKDRIIKEKDEVIRRLLDQQEKLINKL